MPREQIIKFASYAVSAVVGFAVGRYSGKKSESKKYKK